MEDCPQKIFLQPKIKIFSSEQIISSSLQKNYPHFQFLPPIKPGDIITSIDDNTNIVAFLDRSPDASLALSVGEIVDGLRSGIKIYGASEIGAIRAKECIDMGMIGIGKIFDFLQQSFFFNEDWCYQSPDGFSYVDFFFMLEANHCLTPIEKKEYLDFYNSLNYKKRTLENIQNHYKKTNIFSRPHLSQKSIDAATLLETIVKDLQEIQQSNLAIWKRQRQQFTKSECEMVWKV